MLNIRINHLENGSFIVYSYHSKAFVGQPVGSYQEAMAVARDHIRTLGR